ncbi:MAG: hypothetical protein NC388_05745 [Clostridium sp.]|nr:hypothetical protein [Clostridium sp.]
MTGKRRKQNLRMNLAMEGVGLLVTGVCLWLDLRTEATIIGALLVVNALITGAFLWQGRKEGKNGPGATGKTHRS